jgi:N-acetyl-1-D-myo-inositol-2-amino-2-deoxy-alpha-D-glucopyranoside deacetylase
MEEANRRGRLALLCVHAHPDDEAIATGGVLARYAEEGIRTAVVTCTGGELGEIVGAGMDPDELRPRLAAVRKEELGRSLQILGAGEPRLLGYRDSGMLGTAGNADPASFWAAPFDEAVGRLVGHLRQVRPDVLVTYDAFGNYGHPDHVQAHRVAVCAAEACALPALYPEAGPAWHVRKVYFATVPQSAVRTWNAELARRGLPSPFEDEGGEAIPIGVPDELLTTVVDVRPWLHRKWEALRAHASQLSEASLFLNVPEELRDLAFGQEFFVRHRSSVQVPDGAEDDLFAGLRGAARA